MYNCIARRSTRIRNFQKPIVKMKLNDPEKKRRAASCIAIAIAIASDQQHCSIVDIFFENLVDWLLQIA